MHCFLKKLTILLILYLAGLILLTRLNNKTAIQLYQDSSTFPSSSSVRLNILHSTPAASRLSTPAYYEDRTKCANTNKKSIHRLISNRKQNSDLINYLGFVLRSHSLFYCSVPKVATRTLLAFITYLHIRDELIPLFINQSTSNNSTLNSTTKLADIAYFNKLLFPLTTNHTNPMLYDPISILQVILRRLLDSNKKNSSKIDLWSIYLREGLPQLRLRSLSNPITIFSKKFTRVIFVRHPLERLASAYTDKIGSLKNEPLSWYDNIRRGICRRFASSYLNTSQVDFYRIHRRAINNTSEPCANIIPTFEHFIRFIMVGSLQDDVHWQSYSKLCHACLIKYNFIGKYETISNDLSRLKLHLGLDLNVWHAENYFRTGKTKENYKALYSNLTKSVICQLKRFYNEDFQLFDYRLEDYTNKKRNIRCYRKDFQLFKRM